MRLAAETYLPRQVSETQANYARRLARSTLHNYYKSSIQAAVGKVFAENIHVDKPSVPIALVINDVDAQGQNISQFAKSVLEDAINHGVSFILVDHTRVPQDYPSLADQLDSGARPYWVSIHATKVLDARSGDFGGSQRLAYFRYEEEVYEPSADGFTGSSFRQVRIFRQDPKGSLLPDGSISTATSAVMFAVYRETDRKEWTLIDSGELKGISAIPVVPVYTNRLGFFLGRPPLQDLADVNIQHWQCSSDYQNSVHVATIPFLLTKGLQAQMDSEGNLTQMTVDVNAGVMATDANASVEWIEVQGAALAAAKANLDSLVDEMEKLGTTLCSQAPGGITATKTFVDAAEQNSIVKNWALSLQDAINGGLFFTAEYLGESVLPVARVNLDFATDYANDQTMRDVLDMHTGGIIDAPTVIAEAKRRNVLNPLVDIKAAGTTEAAQPVNTTPNQS